MENTLKYSPPSYVLACVLIASVTLGYAAGSEASPDEEIENRRLELLVQTLYETKTPLVRAALLRGMLAGFEGRRSVSPPRGWSLLSNELAGSENSEVRELSARLSQVFGDEAATRQSLAIVRDNAAEAGARRSALRSLLNQQNKEASALLKSLLDEPDLVTDAIRGFAIVENPSAAELLLNRYPKLTAEQRRAVVETLAARRSYARALLAAIERKTVPRSEIPPHVTRAIRSVVGDEADAVLGKLKSLAIDREKLIAGYKALITPTALADADASRGRAVFRKTCASCHTLYGEGAKVGPDLTGSNRANLDYILLNSVDPSFDVPDAYKTVSILTVDGRLVNGVLAEEDGSRVVLRTVEQPRHVIAKEDIEDRVVSAKSMMPEGQLKAMKSQEILDLIKYLRTTEQVELPQ